MAAAGALVPLVLIGGGLAALAFAHSSSAATPTHPPAPGPLPSAPVVPGPPVVNPHPKYDANLPASLEAAVDQELLYEKDANVLFEFGQSLQIQGFPIAAGVILSRAAVLNLQPDTPPDPIQPSPPPPPQPIPQPPIIVPHPPDPPPPVPPPPSPSPPSSIFGVDVRTWDPSWSVAEPVAGATSRYHGSKQHTIDIQNALNEWAQQVEFDPDMVTGLYPLAHDGAYGPKTTKVAANFQEWLNRTQAIDYGTMADSFAPLVVDGIVGPLTLTWLAPWSPNPGVIAA